MKYLIIYGDFTHRKEQFFIIFDIKGVEKNKVKNYMDRFYADLRNKTDLLQWDNYLRFYDLFKVKNENLKDIKDFLFMRRYLYFDSFFRLNESDLNKEFLLNYPELSIL